MFYLQCFGEKGLNSTKEKNEGDFEFCSFYFDNNRNTYGVFVALNILV